MRFVILMLAAASPAALAHTPSDTLEANIGHVLSSPHHLPLVLLLVVLTVLIARRVRRER